MQEIGEDVRSQCEPPFPIGDNAQALTVFERWPAVQRRSAEVSAVPARPAHNSEGAASGGLAEESMQESERAAEQGKRPYEAPAIATTNTTSEDNRARDTLSSGSLSRWTQSFPRTRWRPDAQR